jgi:CAAX prenyl protease-like protein
MPEQRRHGWWPYLAPYGLLLVLIEIGNRLPNATLALMALKILVPGGLLLYFARKGAYPELSGYRLRAGTLADIAVGLGIAALWVGPYLVFPALTRGDPFDPDVLGAERSSLVLGARLVGFAAVTPFVEELFVRSFLHRYLDVWSSGGDFRDQPIARYTRVAFVGTVVWFTLTHAPWEWWVALPTGVLFNLRLYRRGQLGAVVVAHATANAAIWLLVVFGEGDLWPFL